jgi:DNA-binding NarL/FixJ family response regulator
MASKRGPSISVLVVDDHRTFAEALALAMAMEKDLNATSAWGGMAGIAAADREQPDVVLIDLVMPGIDGLEVIRRIRQVQPRARILALSGHDEDLMKARALEAGARGWVSKLTPVGELPDIVRRAHRGEALIDPEETARLLRYLRHRRHQLATERQRANRLTPRQTQILQLLSDGVTPAEITRRLHVTPATLRTHVQNVLTRLGVHTKVEAVALAMRHGKISAEA